MKKSLHLFLMLFCFSLVRSQSVTVISQTNSPCFNACVGAVTFSVTGGTPPYAVSGGCTSSTTTPFTGSTITLTGLCPTCPVYNFIFTDALFSVIGTKTVNISSPPPMFAIMSKTNVCCFGLCNGAISPTITGGTSPYSYTWSPITAGPGFNISNLCAGNYTLSIMDSNGCQGTYTNTITQPAPFTLSVTSAATSCSSCCDGSITATASGGTAPYSYSVIPSGSLSNNCVGNYTVCASDNGCCVTCNTVSIGTSTATGVGNFKPDPNTISVYPNPSNGHFFINGIDQNSPIEFEVYDALGKMVDKGRASRELFLKNASSGIYELRLIGEKQTVYRQKIEVLK